MPNDYKVYQIAVKYSNIFHSEALQNFPKLIFLVRKCARHLATLPIRVGSRPSNRSREQMTFVAALWSEIRQIVNIRCTVLSDEATKASGLHTYTIRQIVLLDTIFTDVVRQKENPIFAVRHLKVSYDTIFTDRSNPIFCRTTSESVVQHNFHS
jgi:hypothetical protein